MQKRIAIFITSPNPIELGNNVTISEYEHIWSVYGQHPAKVTVSGFDKMYIYDGFTINNEDEDNYSSKVEAIIAECLKGIDDSCVKVFVHTSEPHFITKLRKFFGHKCQIVPCSQNTEGGIYQNYIKKFKNKQKLTENFDLIWQKGLQEIPLAELKKLRRIRHQTLEPIVAKLLALNFNLIDNAIEEGIASKKNYIIDNLESDIRYALLSPEGISDDVIEAYDYLFYTHNTSTEEYADSIRVIMKTFEEKLVELENECAQMRAGNE